MTEPSHLRIAIVGAGIGGLVLGAALALRGLKPVVFEARSEEGITTEGLFLTVAPNGMNGLRAIDAMDEVRVKGIDMTGLEILNAAGRRIGFIDQSSFETRFGAPSCTLTRGELVAVLLARARSVGVEVRFESAVAAISDTGNEVSLTDSGGRTEMFDAVVAADGVRSKVRELAFPDFPMPTFTGQVGTGGVIDAPVPDTNGVMRMTFGEKAFFGYIKAQGRPVYWFNSFLSNEYQTRADNPVLFANRILTMHATDPEPNLTILQHLDRLDRAYPIYDVPRLKSWARGRVVLMGDAAHAFGPHAGQGASLAIEDGIVLAHCLTTFAGHTEAFRRFHLLRSRRVDKVAAITAQTGSRKASTGPVAVFFRDLFLPMFVRIGGAVTAKLYVFRVDQTPLSAP